MGESSSVTVLQHRVTAGNCHLMELGVWGHHVGDVLAHFCVELVLFAAVHISRPALGSPEPVTSWVEMCGFWFLVTVSLVLRRARQDVQVPSSLLLTPVVSVESSQHRH